MLARLSTRASLGLWLFASALMLVTSACSDDSSELPPGAGAAAAATGTAAGGAGSGTSTSSGGLDLSTGGNASGGGNVGGGNGTCNTQMTGTIRDFQQSHPDFEQEILGNDLDIVTDELGPDDKPVYAGGSGTATTSGQDNFDQWYRNTPGVNQSLPLTLDMTEGQDGVFTFDSSAFFPIDGQGFGNEGNPHNYHFTFELHTEFVYGGGEVFRFTGDDDLFTYVNRRLVINLGGVHGAISDEVHLDDVAAELGLEQGKTYPLDFFFAERHLTESNFRIDTTISFIDCGSYQPN